MPEAFTLRDAVPGDEAIVLRFVRELAEYEKLLHEVRATEAQFRAALFGPRPDIFGLIAEHAGGPVGFALWFTTFSTFNGSRSAYVEDVYVRPAQRGFGIGKALFRAVARWALANGCERMEWSVLDWNAPAIAFYRSIGAQPMDEWTVQRLEGAALTALAA